MIDSERLFPLRIVFHIEYYIHSTSDVGTAKRNSFVNFFFCTYIIVIYKLLVLVCPNAVAYFMTITH